MDIHEHAKLFVESNLALAVEMPAFVHREEKYSRYPIPSKVAGIYFIYTQNDKILCYIGETGDCIKSRISRHKRSMNEPNWKPERSGKKFVAAGVQEEVFVVKYIPAEKLNLKTKHDRLTAESLFVTALKPVVYKDA